MTTFPYLPTTADMESSESASKARRLATTLRHDLTHNPSPSYEVRLHALPRCQRYEAEAERLEAIK